MEILNKELLLEDNLSINYRWLYRKVLNIPILKYKRNANIKIKYLIIEFSLSFN
jgi:hypothetical protein